MTDPGATLAILGPTASGKTAVAVEVALRLGGEIISLDSRQVYRGMDIGTAKPSLAERRGVPHFGFDLVDPAERFNAGRFAALARTWIAGIRARGAVPILTGGTGFFLRALTHPMFDEPPLDAASKEAVKRVLADYDVATLVRWADALDPDTSVRDTDRQRLARVIEIALLTGRPLSWWQRNAAAQTPALAPVTVVIDVATDVLRERIDRRVDAMLDAGLVEEVRGLLERGCTERDPGLRTTGYTEMVPYLRGHATLAEAAEQVRIATRQYARRQRTWLRHQLAGGVTRIAGDRAVADMADDIVQIWAQETG